ncbi:hypothetical protein LOK49_LG15G00521 [Camellia lanceoleosa]|uniref:Uncharacterized protein n=1 Tax=Camellia lanceoleosa TaxID=1840588 RepID=A0ACC0F8C3_9ERIC|nr:hypothetical protein LOK49_LG15G00521 [Camellia lanceoleosa]
MSPVVRPTRHSIVCEAAPNKKADSAAKRARQAEKRRVYNKARKSEVKTRMKKEVDKEKQKRETEDMGDAMKSLENRTLDSKRDMDILAALG